MDILANIRLKIIAVILFLTIPLVWWFTQHVSNLEHDQKDMKQTIEQQNAVLEAHDKDLKLLDTIGQKIDAGFAKANNGLIALKNKLAAEKLRENATVAPSETEVHINKLNEDTNRCNEIVTGSPIVAEDADNEMCPGLIHKEGPAQ